MRRDAFLRLDDIKQTIWLTRPDLRQQFADNPARFDWWLLLNGATEYRSLAEVEVVIDAALLTPGSRSVCRSAPPANPLYAGRVGDAPGSAAGF